MVLVCGIDEAGRGSVIGPLTIAGIIIEEDKIPELQDIGVKDSKLLLHKKRELLAKKIKKLTKNKILIIQPKEIDAALNSDHLNLNWLEAHKSVEIINYLKPDKAVIDSPSPNLRAYKDFIYSLIKNKKIELIVEHKADLKYPVVAAASILAKVIRENEMEKIKKKYGNCGPGYTSNKITQKFLKENFKKYPEIFRKTWIPYKKLQEQDNNKKLTNFK